MGLDLRLFVGIYPPERTAIDLIALLAEQPLADCRHPPPSQVHLTLHFIGKTPPARLEHTIESVRRSAGGISPFRLQPLRLITLPRGPRPRLIAVETDCPGALLELRRRLVARLAFAPRRRSDDRFLPHMTLSRFRPGERVSRVSEAIDLDPFEVGEIRLMRSVLLPQGAEHRVIETVALSGRSRPRT